MTLRSSLTKSARRYNLRTYAARACLLERYARFQRQDQTRNPEPGAFSEDEAVALAQGAGRSERRAGVFTVGTNTVDETDKIGSSTGREAFIEYDLTRLRDLRRRRRRSSASFQPPRDSYPSAACSCPGHLQ